MHKRAVVVSGGRKDGLARRLGVIDQDTVVIGVDGGASYLVNEGIRVDIAIGDFDSISAEDLQNLEAHVPKVVKLPSEKDLTDTEAALAYIKRHLPVAEIEMHGLFGGRVDHMISNLWLAHHPDFQELIDKITIKDENNTVAFFKPGEFSLKKEMDKKYLSFIGMTPITDLTLQKVKYPLAEKDYGVPIALVSNEFLGDEAQFSFTEGLLAVIQSKD